MVVILKQQNGWELFLTAFLGIPFFWGTDKQVLCALAEVIETQIQKQGSFFGIKVV